MAKLSLETPSDKECEQDVQIMQELNLTRCKSPNSDLTFGKSREKSEDKALDSDHVP